MSDLPEDKRGRKPHKVVGWLSATAGVILLNIAIAFLSVSKSSLLGWTLFVAGLAFLDLTLRLVRSSRYRPNP
jgi:hypothetical protein